MHLMTTKHIILKSTYLYFVIIFTLIIVFHSFIRLSAADFPLIFQTL